MTMYPDGDQPRGAFDSRGDLFPGAALPRGVYVHRPDHAGLLRAGAAECESFYPEGDPSIGLFGVGAGPVERLFYGLRAGVLDGGFRSAAYPLRDRDVHEIRALKDILANINKVFENRVRLGIMSLLMVNDDMDFNTMKETLHLTDGNLASHANTLEKKGYIEVKKEFVGKKPQTTYKATKGGRKAFSAHIDALEQLLKQNLR